MRKNYTTLIFDAFDTVVHVNRGKLPPCLLNGQTIHTTAPAVHSVYEREFENIKMDLFYSAFSQSFTDTEQLRRTHFREVPSQERFREMLRLLGRREAEITPAILDSLTLAHMNLLQQALEVRQETIDFLDWTSGKYRRAMISNFDYAPALYDALQRFGIRSVFETIVVSVEAGWRKPHPLIFERTIEAMGVRPADALFIGDQLYLDVLGGIQAGMDVVWLDTGREVWTAEFPKPTYTVASILEIIGLLEVKN